MKVMNVVNPITPTVFYTISVSVYNFSGDVKTLVDTGSIDLAFVTVGFIEN